MAPDRALEEELRAEFTVHTMVIDILGLPRLHLLAVQDIGFLVDRAATEDDLPFWAEVWPAGLGLATYLSQLDLSGAKVLELGCGLGIGGIAASLCGAQVLQTDLHPDALRFARANAARNNASGICWARADWRNFPIHDRFDLIIGADILYEPAVHRHLLEIITTRLVEGGRAVIADPGREFAFDFMNRLDAECKPLGFSWSWEEVQLDQRKAPAISIFVIHHEGRETRPAKS